MFTKSVQFFVGHNSDNSTDGRKSLGEVVGSFVKEIDGKLSTIAVGFFPDKDSVNAMDVCSIEADVITGVNNLVSDIKSLTGIALGSSNVDSPAFPGAKRLATLQCFDQDGNDPGKNKNHPGEGDKPMTFEEIKKGIRELNVMPWQVYEVEDLKKDRTFGEYFDKLEKLEKENQEFRAKVDTLEKEKTDAIKKGQQIDAKERLKNAVPEGATEAQKKFILDRFNPDNMEDLSDDGLKNYVAQATKDFSEVAKLFGVTEENNDSDSGSNDGSGGESSADPVTEALNEIVGE